MNNVLQRYNELINAKLDELLPKSSENYSKVIDAMRYSLLAGGKRIRPALVLEFCRLCGGDVSKAVNFACAVEMIHTYSLIHDDLPCMDDDDYRRGEPSCHKVFGYDIALLAGDALQSLAFEIIAKSELPSDRVARAVLSLSKRCGVDGMVGGQVLDLANENAKNDVEIELVKQTYLLKTSALIKTACELGCIAAGKYELLDNAEIFADNLGLAFQIRDDVLDVIGDSETLGKAVGSDDKNCKSTFVSAYGIDRSNDMVKNYSETAKQALDCFGEAADDLRELVDLLVNRIN